VYSEVELSAILSDDLSVSLSRLPSRSYNVTEHELLAIAALVRQAGTQTAFEIGTADGRTTLNIANNMMTGGTVFTLNLPLEKDRGHSQDVPVGHHFKGRHDSTRIVQLWGDSTRFDFSPYYGKCQSVFVDGDHFEPGVGRDCETALRLVDRRDGVVLWHDALRYDVQRVLPRMAREEPLPIHLIAGTNLAVLFFLDGRAVVPSDWALRKIMSPGTNSQGSASSD
jgi:hypothetical protein